SPRCAAPSAFPRSAPWPSCPGRRPTPMEEPCEMRLPLRWRCVDPSTAHGRSGPPITAPCATSCPWCRARPVGSGWRSTRCGPDHRRTRPPRRLRSGRHSAGRRDGPDTMTHMSRYSIRLYGDPVLRQRTADVHDIDGSLKQLADDMVQTMYEAPGVGLAAPQVGVQKRMFVYDTGDGEGPVTVVNPVLAEARGEWTFDEGCLSVPGLSWPIVRPKEVHLTGFDLDGNEISVDADEFLARVFLHEV